MMSQLFGPRPDEIVTYELREGVAWLGLNQPEKRNAINNRLLTGLAG
jgi:enoyl-CoA hydratase/carnithine racemase